MKKTFDDVATALAISFCGAAILSVLLPCLFLTESALSVTLMSLAGIQLLVFILFAMINSVQRSKILSLNDAILKADQQLTPKLHNIKSAYNQWLRDHSNLADLITTLQQEVGEPHTCDASGG